MNLEHCFYNIPRSSYDRPVYRIMNRKHLAEMFQKRLNTLVKPFLWDDPFENFMQGFKGQLPSGEVVEFAQRFDFYGQCWTLRGASDAMWRIYSSDKQSVRIKVRIKTLVETLARRAHGIVLLGSVRYLDTKGSLKWARRLIRESDDPDVRLLARTLLVKRTIFSHEQEVRLLYFDTGAGGKLFQYGFDPHRFVEEIVVDPRLPPDQATALVNEIRTTTQFRGPIYHSDLYAPPQELVLRLGAAYSSLPRTSSKVAYKDGLRTESWTYPRAPTDQILLPVRDLLLH
jgi:hypothetical protein